MESSDKLQTNLSDRRKASSAWENHIPGPIMSGPGCPFSCIYCNQTSLDFEGIDKNSGYLYSGVDGGISINDKIMIKNQVVKTIPQETLFKELKKYPYYFPESPVLLRNFTDPSLEWDSSISLARGLIEEFDHKGPIVYITKGGIPDKYITEFKEVQKIGARIIFIISYSGLPQRVEPIPAKTRINIIKKLSESNLPVILSMRPLIQGINLTKENVGQIAMEVGSDVDAITNGGLYVYDFTRKAFDESGYPLPDLYDPKAYSESKVMEDGDRTMVRNTIIGAKVKTPVFDHTTCALAYVMQKKYGVSSYDRLAHWGRGNGNLFDKCRHICPKDQFNLCLQVSQADKQNIIKKAQDRLHKIGYKNKIIPSNVPGTLLIKDGSLHLSEMFSIEEACGWHIENLPTADVVRSKVNTISDMNFGIGAINIVDVRSNNEGVFVFVKDLDEVRLNSLQNLVKKGTRSNFIEIRNCKE